jgi:hypothetical protein
MTVNSSQDGAPPDPAQARDEFPDLQRAGTGAASALERMKADHALRHKRQHGGRTSGPGHGDDRTPER